MFILFYWQESHESKPLIPSPSEKNVDPWPIFDTEIIMQKPYCGLQHLCFRFPKSWEYPLPLACYLFYIRMFHEMKHPAIGVPPWLGKHPYGLIILKGFERKMMVSCWITRPIIGFFWRWTFALCGFAQRTHWHDLGRRVIRTYLRILTSKTPSYTISYKW